MRAVAGFAVAFASACYSPNAATGVPCSSNFMCPGSQMCDRGQSPPVCVGTLVVDAARGTDGSRNVDADIDAQLTTDALLGDAALVQQATGHQESGGTLAVGLLHAPQAGDMLIMVGAFIQGPMQGVSGGGVMTWHQAASSVVTCDVEIWYGLTDGSPDPVTIALPGSTSQSWINVAEWSGLVTPDPFDVGNSGGGSAATATAGTFTTTHDHDLVLLGVTDGLPNTFGNPGPGTWTALDGVAVSNCMQAAWYRVIFTAANHGESVSQTDNNWDAAVAAFAIAP